ncbi:MAG: DEAD/DEAH box helicase, partial [Proteobacteria bacterium]
YLKFQPHHFDYIVVDETHRAAAQTYDVVLQYFKPKFILGMTATPERTDGNDVFKLFDYNIAYEIRLNRALEEQMLVPFHYYGVTEIRVEGREITEDAAFNLLVAPERVRHIADRARFYGTDCSDVRGLVFCSKNEESAAIADQFIRLGYRAVALSGASSDLERAQAIERLESEDPSKKLDYIFTVDIFNEGIDIPKVNQVILLRPTQSAIVFVQQLGRGLRKAEGKSYLTVIDFIGNYKNNFLVPVALFGDQSYNKDVLRRLVSSGSSLVPGSSTIDFDKISRDRIFESITNSNLQTKKDLVNDYKLVKYRIGRPPLMVDFLNQNGRDPYQYVIYSRSYYNFLLDVEAGTPVLSQRVKVIFESLAKEVNNGKKIQDSIALFLLLNGGPVTF